MQKFFLFLITIIAFIDIKAQTSQEPQKILDQASAKLRASSGIVANFSLIQKDKNNHAQGSAKGVVKIKGDKYYVEEGKTKIFCNGDQIWNFDGQSEVTVTKAGDDADDLSPQQMLSGFNKADFSSKLISSTGTNYQVQLLPVDKRKNFKQVIIFVNKSNSLLTKAIITDKTGNVTEISFSGIKLNASLSDAQFSFDASKYPGVEVINQ